MIITIAKSAGFCFGVKRALDLAFKTLSSKKNVYILGDIVHNENVIAQLKGAGIKKAKRLTLGKGKTLLIRAHGASIKLTMRTRKLGYDIVDATCPMVKEIHKIAKDLESRGLKVIVIGDKNHDEVHGIAGQLKSKALVIEKPQDVNSKGLSRVGKAGVVVQSTQNINNVLEIMEVLKPKIKELYFYNTICKPTKIKQEEIKVMPLENDAMLIVGSKTSANTRRLYEISQGINPKTYWVNSRDEIKPEWLNGVKRLGITAGASTPDRTINEILEYVKKTC